MITVSINEVKHGNIDCVVKSDRVNLTMGNVTQFLDYEDVEALHSMLGFALQEMDYQDESKRKDTRL